MPPRDRYTDYRDDPWYQIYHQTAYKEDRIRPGYLEQREIVEMYTSALDLDAREAREFWADYLHYMVSDRSHVIRNDRESNPFWDEWGIDPDQFDWHGWREAMGYGHGARR